jgi:hypothetical protein
MSENAGVPPLRIFSGSWRLMCGCRRKQQAHSRVNILFFFFALSCVHSSQSLLWYLSHGCFCTDDFRQEALGKVQRHVHSSLPASRPFDRLLFHEPHCVFAHVLCIGPHPPTLTLRTRPANVNDIDGENFRCFDCTCTFLVELFDTPCPF